MPPSVGGMQGMGASTTYFVPTKLRGKEAQEAVEVRCPRAPPPPRPRPPRHAPGLPPPLLRPGGQRGGVRAGGSPGRAWHQPDAVRRTPGAQLLNRLADVDPVTLLCSISEQLARRYPQRFKNTVGLLKEVLKRAHTEAEAMGISKMHSKR